MSSDQQALLMVGSGGASPPAPVCIADPYYDNTVDEYFQYIQLLLHGDGTNGGTTITDNGRYRRSPGGVGGFTTSTTTPKFGTAALYTNAGSPLYYAATEATSESTFGGSVILYIGNTGTTPNPDFTIEVWSYETGSSAGSICSMRTSGSSFGWAFTTSSIRARIDGAWSDTQLTWTRPSLNAWHHIAWSRVGSNLYVHVDGILVASKSITTIDAEMHTVLSFGQSDNGSENRFIGYLDDFRFTRQISRYSSSNFSVPTSAFLDNPQTTVLSLHAESAVDSSPNPKTVTLTGSASISSTQSKYGSNSFLIPNVGTSTANGVVVTDDADFDFGLFDFTIDFWAYRNANTYVGYLFLFSGPSEFSLRINTSGQLVLNAGMTSSGSFTSVDTFPLAQWNYVVVQRNSAANTVEVYLNGVSVGSCTASGSCYAVSNIYIGRTGFDSATTFNGYIDDFRITRGIRRYTTSFTPPALTFCDSTTSGPGITTTVNLLGQAVTASIGTVSQTSGNATLVGSRLTITAGSSTGSSISVAPYPDLLRTTYAYTDATGSVPLSIYFRLDSDGTILIHNPTVGPDWTTVGRWIEVSSSYNIVDIANQYNFSVFDFGASTVVSYDTTTYSGNLIMLILAAPIGSAVYDSQISITPKTVNPRYGEVGYSGAIRVKIEVIGLV